MTAVFLSVDGQSPLYLIESLVSPDHCFGDKLVISSFSSIETKLLKQNMGVDKVDIWRLERWLSGCKSICYASKTIQVQVPRTHVKVLTVILIHSPSIPTARG